MAGEIRIIGENDSEFLAVAGGGYRVVVDGAATSNTFTVFDMVIPSDGGPTSHSRASIQERLCVTEDEIEYKAESGKSMVENSNFIYVHRGDVIHFSSNLLRNIALLLYI